MGALRLIGFGRESQLLVGQRRPNRGLHRIVMSGVVIVNVGVMFSSRCKYHGEVDAKMTNLITIWYSQAALHMSSISYGPNWGPFGNAAWVGPSIGRFRKSTNLTVGLGLVRLTMSKS